MYNVYVSLPAEVLNKYVGESESNIRYNNMLYLLVECIILLRAHEQSGVKCACTRVFYA